MAELALLSLVAVIIGINALLAISLNIQFGEAGLLNFGVAGFFAVGAYTSAVLTTPVDQTGFVVRTVGFDLPIVVGILAGTILAGIVGLGIATTSIRLDGDYLAIVTLGFAEIIRLLIRNVESVTGGVQALRDIRRPLSDVFGANYSMFYFVLVLGLMIGILAVFYRLSNSAFGRVLHAIREDEIVPKALGKDTIVFKLKAFALGAAVAGLAGALWAHYSYAITPAMFNPVKTFDIWAAVIIGGAGSYLGAIGGTIFIIGIAQLTRFIPETVPFSAELPLLRQTLIASLMILILYYRPYGLLGNKERNLAGTSGGGS